MPITTTITAGSSATIALAAGSSLALSGYGTAQVVPPAPQGVDPGLLQLVPTETRIGPFLAAVSVNVVATAAVSYYLAGATDVAASSGAQALSQVQQTVSVSAYVGTWAGKPSASAAGVGAVITITDVGVGGYSQWRSDGTYWRPFGPVFLYHSTTQVVGSASASAQLLSVTSGIVTEVWASCRLVQCSWHLSKSGITDAVTAVNAYLGANGTSADTNIYNTSAFTAASRQFSGGVRQRWNASTTKMQHAVAQQANALETNVAATTAYPSGTSSAMSAATAQYLSLYVTMAGTTDTPALERLTVVGY